MSAALLLSILLSTALTAKQDARDQDAQAEQRALQATFEEFQAASDARQWAEAERLALNLLQRQRAQWSVNNLAILWTRLGKYAEADALLAEEMERLSALKGQWRQELTRAEEADDAALAERARDSLATLEYEHTVVLERRGLVARAAGEPKRARRYLGSALARGGRDAAQILAHEAWVSGRYAEARALFRGLLLPRAGESAEDLNQIAPWALRGWGLSLLPAARTSDGVGLSTRNPPAIGD